MPIRSAAVGATVEVPVVDITPRWTIAYAAGTGDTNPCYFDDAAPEGVMAPPAFCVALEWPAALMIRMQPALGLRDEEFLRGVHAAQDSLFHRPIRAGNRLRTSAALIQIRAITPGAFVLTKFTTVDADTGEPVVTSYSSGIYRGVKVEGDDAQIEEAPALPGSAEGGVISEQSEQVALPIAREAPHVYTECAQIWNPIHTERRVAFAAGLPDIILHGTATWALAARELVNRCAGGDPTRLQRFVGRFTAMVIPGTTITLHYDATARNAALVPFTVRNADGTPAISHGLAQIAP